MMVSPQYEFTRRLGADWRDLAGVLGIPEHQQRRFEPGYEPHGIWSNLVDQDRLAQLPSALSTIGRADLADVLLRDGSDWTVASSQRPDSSAAVIVIASGAGSVAIGGDNYGEVRISR